MGNQKIKGQDPKTPLCLKPLANSLLTSVLQEDNNPVLSRIPTRCRGSRQPRSGAASRPSNSRARRTCTRQRFAPPPWQSQTAAALHPTEDPPAKKKWLKKGEHNRDPENPYRRERREDRKEGRTEEEEEEEEEEKKMREEVTYVLLVCAITRSLRQTRQMCLS